MIAAAVGEGSFRLSGEENRVVLLRVIDKFLETKKTMESTIKTREAVLEELRKEIIEKDTKFEEMKEVIKDCEERIGKRFFNEIEKQREQVLLLVYIVFFSLDLLKK